MSTRRRRKRKRMNRKTRRNYFIFILILAVAVFLLGSCVSHVIGGGSHKGESSKPVKEEQVEKSEPVEFTVMCVGDIMAHSPNIKSAASGDGYDFSDNYEYVSDYISQADLSLCNMETTFAGGTPQGYPLFNAPDQLASAVKAAGFDVAFTSNNHMLDTGIDGAKRSLTVLRDAGLETVGSHLEGEKTYLVTEVKGVKVGLVSYTYETSEETGGSLSINGNTVSAEAGSLINSFSYAELESTDYNKIQADIDGCRNDGAQLVICYLHWGEEYQQTPNEKQTKMAARLADMGADIIFASHPHVPQGADVLTASDGRKVPVFYSMGNFISNQRAETLSNRYTENGTMVFVAVSYDPDKNVCKAESVKIIPTWVDKYGSSSIEYRIIPLDGSYESNPSLAESGHLSRAQTSYQDALSMYGPLLNGELVSNIAKGAAADASAGSGSDASAGSGSEAPADNGSEASADNGSDAADDSGGGIEPSGGDEEDDGIEEVGEI